MVDSIKGSLILLAEAESSEDSRCQLRHSYGQTTVWNLRRKRYSESCVFISIQLFFLILFYVVCHNILSMDVLSAYMFKLASTLFACP